VSAQDSLSKWRPKGTVVAKPLLVFVAHPYVGTGQRWLTGTGLPVTESADEVAETSFLIAFQTCAAEVGAAYLMDSFDSRTLLIDADHKARFVELLDWAPDDEAA